MLKTQEQYREELHQELSANSIKDGIRNHRDQDTRAYIATKLMAGIMSNPEFYGPSMQGDSVAAAETAVRAADALLYTLHRIARGSNL